MQPNYTPPIWPSNSNGIEARTKALEVARAYDMRDASMLRDELIALRQELHSLMDALQTFQRKAALYTIMALLSAVSALALIVVKVKAPWILMP